MAYYQPNPYGPSAYPPPQPQGYCGYEWQQPYYQPQPPQPPLPAPETLPPPPALHRPEDPQPQAPVAFTRVTPKASTSSTPKSEERPSGWPDSLRAYTQRAFICAKTSEDKAQLQVHLKALINTAQQRGELWTTDWELMPLPECSKRAEDREPKMMASRESSVSVYRPASPFKMTFSRKPNLKRERSLSPSSRSSTPPRALTKKERKALRKQEQERRRMVSMKLEPLQDVQPDWHNEERERARARRFGNGNALGAVSGRSQKSYHARSYEHWDAADTIEVDGCEAFQAASAVRGTCQEVEKSYFRLTSKPDPSVVRPEPVLQKALSRLVGLLRGGKVTYFYAADQFKGMRQDCTVQHLCNATSASIYEAHARSALEHGDTAEYNQCQAQLMQHYQAGIVGAQQEFTAYRLLYQSIHAGRGNHAGVLSCLQSISPEDAEHPFVKHALQVRQALAAGDCMQVCLLYSSAPNMSRALLDMVLPRLQLTALKILAKAYLPNLPIPFIATRLAFLKPTHTTDSHTLPLSAGPEALPGCTKASFPGRHAPQADSSQGEASCIAWLREHGAVLIPCSGGKGGLAMDCKASIGKLKAPEKSSAPAHGPDLAIDDFLARAVA